MACTFEERTQRMVEHGFLETERGGHGICPECSKVEGRSHIRCEETKNWRDRLLEKIGIRKIASNKIKDIWQKLDSA
jgi:hypothetical protein